MELCELKEQSRRLRRQILDTVYHAGGGHIGGDLSVCDILNVLYNRQMDITPQNWNTPGRDHFILSKGHAAEALYCTLAGKGFFPPERMEGMGRFGTGLPGHPNRKVPGVEANTGSLGHGLSLGVGMALAERMNQTGSFVYVVMGDGELAEDSVWEAAMAASHHHLERLIALVDRNRLQISGPTEQVMAQDPQQKRWEAFGWRVLEICGNDVGAIDQALTVAKTPMGAPTVILCNTVKGCGVSFMENRPEWHHRVPSASEYEQAARELSGGEEHA